MISEVDIGNMALVHLGIKPITSLTEASKPAQTIKLIFSSIRDAVLRAHFWNFASKTELLVSISGEKLVGWQYLYAQPPQCLCIRKVFDDVSVPNPPAAEYKSALSPNSNQRAIAANINPAYIEYTLQVVDPNLFDSAYVMALSRLLASEMAQPLTGDKTLSQENLKIYGLLIDEARRANATESNVKPNKTSAYIDAR